MIGEVFVGPHAVARFIARVAPSLGYEAARAAILDGLTYHTTSVTPSSSGAGVVVRVRGGRYPFRAVIGAGEGAPC